MRCAIAALIVVTSAMSTAACGDEWQSLLTAEPTHAHVVDHDTSLYPERWCILNYIESSRPFRSSADTDLAFFYPSWLDQQALPTDPVDDTPFDADRTSLLSRLEALSSMRLMTLWRGRENALVIGLNRSGYLGISLDEAVASNE